MLQGKAAAFTTGAAVDLVALTRESINKSPKIRGALDGEAVRWGAGVGYLPIQLINAPKHIKFRARARQLGELTATRARAAVRYRRRQSRPSYGVAEINGITGNTRWLGCCSS
jgi:hypothetical protein